MLNQRTAGFLSNIWNILNTQQAAADEADLLVSYPDTQEVVDLQEDDFSEETREDLQKETNGLDTDESSVNHFHLIANLLLELRE